MENVEQIVIITGLSGSGKSVAVKALEDSGYFCIDNMPVSLLPKFLELPLGEAGKLRRVALVMDIRGLEFGIGYREVFEQLKSAGIHLRVVFLDASDEVLINRFKMTRRSHPLLDTGPLPVIIHAERARLADIKEIADLVIDTSRFNLHDLRKVMREHFHSGLQTEQMAVSILSFGFGQGLPMDADLVLDVRFLPNPYFQDELRDLTGVDQPVIDYMMLQEETRSFLDRLFPWMDYLLERYRGGRHFLVIAVGCTGGRHRSVVIAGKLHEYLLAHNYPVHLRHRDM